jgi:hypothetical protein
LRQWLYELLPLTTVAVAQPLTFKQ